MHIVSLAIELNQLRFKVLADGSHDALHRCHVFSFKNTTAIFRNKDQVHMKRKNTVSAVSKFVILNYG